MSRIADSSMYAHQWGTPELRGVFCELGRLQGWLDVLGALARAQAAYGLVPADAAARISALRADQLDLALVGEQTRVTGHSTLGLIRALAPLLPPEVHRHVYVGATVQDLTDTWTACALRTVVAAVRRDLRALEGLLLDLAARHRDTLMAGRTHGQPGAPVTFGWKAAGLADEVHRHLVRLREGEPRWLVGQLGGGVGTLAAHGAVGLQVRARFCAELGLADPAISWLTARDRVAEVGSVLAMVAGTTARLGNEVYELQRPEIGELRETPTPGVVGSITMPHKVNPERSEHLDTLARLVRANAGLLLEGMTGVHERDGRAWKTEWVALPEVCLLTGRATSLAVELVQGLQVDPERMRANLGEVTSSEQLLVRLTARQGKHEAQQALQEALAGGRTLAEAARRLGLPEDSEPDAGLAAAMVDLVLARGRTR